VSGDLSDRRRRGRKFRWKISEGFDRLAELALSYRHILFTIFHGTARAQAGWCAQPYATAQSVCHLPIEQLMKKIESRMPIFFEDCSFQNKTFTKLSPSSDFCEP
jgi:hypothetical protein